MVQVLIVMLSSSGPKEWEETLYYQVQGRTSQGERLLATVRGVRAIG